MWASSKKKKNAIVLVRTKAKCKWATFFFHRRARITNLNSYLLLLYILFYDFFFIKCFFLQFSFFVTRLFQLLLSCDRVANGETIESKSYAFLRFYFEFDFSFILCFFSSTNSHTNTNIRSQLYPIEKCGMKLKMQKFVRAQAHIEMRTCKSNVCIVHNFNDF